MLNATRAEFEKYTAQVASLNGVPSATSTFAVAPSIEQKLEERIQQSSAFLKEVNVIGVDQIKGEVLGLLAASPVAGRTDTATKDREPRSVDDLKSRGYECEDTNFDTYIEYKKLDAWAKFPNFQPLVRNKMVEQCGRDRLMTGWNGTFAASNTDPVAYPLLQDVNIGWLQHLRTDAPQRVMTGVKMGDSGDYRNIDALALDATNSLLDEWYRDANDVVAILGRELLVDKYMAMINSPDSDAPVHKQAMDTIMMNRTVGNRRAILVPFFPPRAVLFTKSKNLSIYYQNGSRRRRIEDQPRRNRIVDYNSVNEAYVIEDLGCCALIENIKLPDGQGGWA